MASYSRATASNRSLSVGFNTAAAQRLARCILPLQVVEITLHPHSVEHGAVKVPLTTSPVSSQHMPLRQEIQFLRDRAQRLREMAGYQTPLSEQLKMMSAELEARADQLQRDQDRSSANQE